jgi:quercetin dioxygenase-like cupin family protein
MNYETELAEKCEDCALDAALYALGTLPTKKALAVEQRIRSGCAFCCAQVEHYASVADQLALSVPPIQPPPELRRRLLDSLSAQPPFAESHEHRKVVRGSDAPWLKSPVPGVEMRPLIGEKTFMVRMQPGTVFPKHDHPQAEQCFVLEGSITDSDGLTLRAGDFVVMSRGTQHNPIRSETGCTLFIAYAD